MSDLANGLLQQIPKGSAQRWAEKRRQFPAFPDQFRSEVEVHEIHVLLPMSRSEKRLTQIGTTDHGLTMQVP